MSLFLTFPERNCMFEHILKKNNKKTQILTESNASTSLLRNNEMAV